MYQIFESDLYLLYEKTLASTTSTTDETQLPSKTKLDSDSVTKDKPEPIPEPKPKPEPIPKPKPEPIPENDDDFENDAEEEDVSPKEKIQAIQKFILYNKLRELQYKLDNISVITNYKNKEDLVKFNKFLAYVIQFFSIFDYAQASQITQRLLDEFKKIK